MSDASWIWGLHSIEACAQTSPEIILEVSADPELTAANRARLLAVLKVCGLALRDQKKLPGFLAEKRTQGVAAKLKSFPIEDYRDFEDEFVSSLESEGRQWAVLDGIQDPRNYGAILRSAAAFGVSAVIVGRRDQSPLTGVVAQASAGNSFRVRNVAATNLSRVIERAKECGAHVLALDGAGKDLREVMGRTKGQSIVWVLGSEGEGLRPGLLSHVTEVVKIPMQPEVESLNASVAASLAFYAAFGR